MYLDKDLLSFSMYYIFLIIFFFTPSIFITVIYWVKVTCLQVILQ